MLMECCKFCCLKYLNKFRAIEYTEKNQNQLVHGEFDVDLRLVI